MYTLHCKIANFFFNRNICHWNVLALIWTCCLYHQILQNHVPWLFDALSHNLKQSELGHLDMWNQGKGEPHVLLKTLITPSRRTVWALVPAMTCIRSNDQCTCLPIVVKACPIRRAIGWTTRTDAVLAGMPYLDGWSRLQEISSGGKMILWTDDRHQTTRWNEKGTIWVNEKMTLSFTTWFTELKETPFHQESYNLMALLQERWYTKTNLSLFYYSLLIISTCN